MVVKLLRSQATGIYYTESISLKSACTQILILHTPSFLRIIYAMMEASENKRYI